MRTLADQCVMMADKGVIDAGPRGGFSDRQAPRGCQVKGAPRHLLGLSRQDAAADAFDHVVNRRTVEPSSEKMPFKAVRFTGTISR